MGQFDLQRGIKVTAPIGNFVAFCQLVRLMRHGIRFLLVKPQFRYRFLFPMHRHVKSASCYGLRGDYAPSGLSSQMYNMPVIPKKRLTVTVYCRCLLYPLWFFLIGIYSFPIFLSTIQKTDVFHYRTRVAAMICSINRMEIYFSIYSP